MRLTKADDIDDIRNRCASASAARWAPARPRSRSRSAARCATAIELAVVTNDIYTEEDAQFLVRNEALAPDRIIGVETGGCPHTAIREDASINLEAVDRLAARFGNLDIVFVESGGDNLAATFSPELSDLTLYVIDVAAGDKIPRKGGPGITRSDLLVINKIDLAPMVGASLEVMDRDARKMRGERPFVFTNLKTGRASTPSCASSSSAAWSSIDARRAPLRARGAPLRRSRSNSVHGRFASHRFGPAMQRVAMRRRARAAMHILIVKQWITCVAPAHGMDHAMQHYGGRRAVDRGRQVLSSSIHSIRGNPCNAELF